VYANNCAVTGVGNIVEGNNCVIYGSDNVVNGNNCRVIGENNTISGDNCQINSRNNVVYGNNCTFSNNNSQQNMQAGGRRYSHSFNDGNGTNTTTVCTYVPGNDPTCLFIMHVNRKETTYVYICRWLYIIVIVIVQLSRQQESTTTTVANLRLQCQQLQQYDGAGGEIQMRCVHGERGRRHCTALQPRRYYYILDDRSLCQFTSVALFSYLHDVL
jgi:hypothetical protein